MKRKLQLTLIFIVLFMFSATAEKYKYTYKFDKPILKTEKGFTEILYKNCHLLGNEGFPLLPQYGVNILLPQNQAIANIKIISTKYLFTKDNIVIKPGVKPVPISLISQNDEYKLTPNQEIYNSSKPYPENSLSKFSTNYLCGHSIGSFAICPVVFVPAKKQVKFIKEITVEIETKTLKTKDGFLKTSPNIENRIKKIVDNPEVLKTYNYSQTKNTNDVDILLITNSVLQPAFDSYISYKTSVGYIVKTVLVDDINNNYSGQDLQEKIRNCIIDYYQNHNLESVILGGDADPANAGENIIPKRDLYAVDDQLASDMYYAGLDGTWNNDGDNRWGEPGEADLYAEVTIGRICADKISEVQNATNKLFMYQNSPVIADIEKTLMLGEELNSYTFGGTYKDEIADGGSSANGYTTVGVPAYFTVHKLYEQVANYDKTDIFNEFNTEGINLLNHLGHSNVTYNMKMYNSDLTTTNFTNDGVSRGYVIGYSQGCYNGSFDNRNTSGSYGGEDCFAEKITTLETAEVACIANSRYGWYEPGGTNSSSQYYDRQFYDAIFGQNLSKIGDVNREAKEKDITMIQNDQYMRWTAYETNLFGDPTMDIWTEAPSDITATYPTNVPFGTSQISVETDAPFARISFMQNDTLIGRGVADNNGNANINLFITISENDPITISIIGHNKNRLQDIILVISNQPYIVLDSSAIDDQLCNNNGLIDYGETIFLSLGFKNFGDQPAVNTTLELFCDDNYIDISDSVESIGNIAAGATVFFNDIFKFSVADNVPDQHNLNFYIKVTSIEDTWDCNLNLLANAPVLNIGEFIINDTVSGNGNGMLDPGDTAVIIVKSSNLGHSDCFNTLSTLTSTNSYLTIENPNCNIGDLPQATTVDAAFNVIVDPATPIPSSIGLVYNLVSEQYQVLDTVALTVGLIVEDFESADFSNFDWASTSSIPWQISNSGAYEGNYCVRSGNIGNNATSNLLLYYYDVLTDDSISFYVKISSEENADYLKFYIDDVFIQKWSGFEDWQKYVFPVSAGDHVFKWEYSKNEADGIGYDRAWVDYILLPPTISTTVYAGVDDTICQGNQYQLSATAENYNTLLWTTSGDGSFDDNTILNPVYTPGDNDISNGSVILTINASHPQYGDAFDYLSLFINPLPPAPDKPQGPEYVDLYYVTSSEYTSNDTINTLSYIWNILPEEAGTISGDSLIGTVTWNPEFKGSAFIKVKGVNECGEGEFSETLEVTVDNTVGITFYNKDKISLFPNPNNGKFTLKFNSDIEEEVNIKLFNAFGSVVYNESNILINGFYSKEFDFDNISNGIYYLSFESNKTKIVKKIIINK